ncbi:glycosyltransferase family 39 protein [Candidatus Shapirobacteria bacterium]|nr:glycosyltransferase family 39 protein [Candidatus Shapirobacteria bacterium]
MKKQSKFLHKVFGLHTAECLIFLVSFLILSVISYEILKYGATTAPDFLQNVFFSDLFSEKKTLLYCNELNEEIFPIFGGRGFRLTVNKECLSHGSMHGFIIILGLAKIIWKDSFYFVVPFFASLALIFFYKICNFFFSKKLSLAGAIILFFFPPFFFFSTLLFNNIPATSLFLAVVYFLIKGAEEDQKWYFYSSAFAGAMIWVRYDYFLFVAPIIFFLFKKVINKSLSLKKLSYISLPFLLFLVFLGLTNINLYGDLFGYKGGDFSSLANFPTDYSAGINTIKILSFLPPISGSVFFTNFYRYIVQDKEIILAFFIFSMFYVFINSSRNENSKKDKLKSFSLLFLSFIIIPIFFYCSSVWSGFKEPQSVVANSYSRYLLPTYTFIIFFLLTTLDRFKSYIKILFFIFYFLWSLNISFFSPGGIVDHIEAQKRFSEIKINYLENIPEENAVVFTIFCDKYIFPDRTTAIYNSFKKDEIEENTIFAINKLFKKKIPIYFIKNEGIFFGDNFFKKNLFRVIEINDSLVKIEEMK